MLKAKSAATHFIRALSCRPYQLGVVGGDLEGRLLVSRCSDEIDLRSTGFQTIPPTTRWHTGPLRVWKEKNEIFAKNLRQEVTCSSYSCTHL